MEARHDRRTLYRQAHHTTAAYGHHRRPARRRFIHYPGLRAMGRHGCQHPGRHRLVSVRPVHAAGAPGHNARGQRQRRNVPAQRPELVAILRIYRQHRLRPVAASSQPPRSAAFHSPVGCRTGCLDPFRHERQLSYWLRLVYGRLRICRRTAQAVVLILGRTPYGSRVQAHACQSLRLRRLLGTDCRHARHALHHH